MPVPARRRCFTIGGTLLPAFVAAALLLPAACIKVRTEVEPIDINVNVRLQVDHELDRFFGDLDEQNPVLTETKEDVES